MPAHPVLLVHGLFASPNLMRPLRRRLRAAGHDVHLVPELSRAVSGDVRGHASELDRAVERVRARTGAREVDVVGASQGGLVALYWASRGGWGRLGRLVTLGTPFHGSPLAGRVAALGGLLPALAQLTPGSAFLGEVETIELQRPVFSIALRGDPVCPPRSCALEGARNVVIEGSFGPLSHQMLMLTPSAASAVHQALIAPC